MYISKLKLHGFKSFSTKETLEFGQGITTIVGPNGCGKTNIVDAIRWVLGEQKYSILRSSKMEDIIFNGAKGIKPLGVCEVYLTVHNNLGKLPVEYTDVEIGRRVYRNGDSEYFINKTPCRLKDIHDLFIDTGMGSDAYSVIELKMIEQILSETSDDRKRMFEEAAGINKYKQQKKSALRKFDATRQDLERVDDIIHEVETKVHGLQLQLKRFKRHEKLTIQLKEQELVLASIKLQNLETRAKPIAKQIQEFHNQRQFRTSAEGKKEQELKGLRESYHSNERELDNLQKEQRAFEEERETIQHDLLRWNEQVKSSESNILRLNEEEKNLNSKTAQQEGFIKDYDSEIKVLEPQIEVKLSAYKEKRSELDVILENTKKIQAGVEDLQKSRWEQQQSLANHRSLLDRTKSLFTEKSNLIEKYRSKIKDLEEENFAASNEQKVLENERDTLSKKLEDIRISKEDLENKVEAEKSKQHDLRMSIQSAKNRIETYTSQKHFFEELIANAEGYPGGVQYVLENKDDFKGLSGTVGDLFSADEKFEKAIESCLGNWASCLVVDNRENALSILKRVNENKAGDVSVIPLNEVSKLKFTKADNPKVKGLLGRASDLVKSNSRNKPILDMLLGNIFIIEKLDESIGFIPGITFVDLEGGLISADALMKNFSGAEGKSLLGRQKKIESLDKRISKLQDEIKKTEDELTNSQERLNSLSQKSLTQKQLNDGLNKELSELETKIIKNHYGQSKALESLRDLKNDLETTANDVNQLKASIEKLGPDSINKESKLNKTAEILSNKETELVEARTRQEEFNRQVQEVRIELLNIENQKEGLVYQKRTAEEALIEIRNRLSDIKEELSGLAEKKQDLEKNIEEGNLALTKVQGKLTKQNSIVELKRQAFNALFAEIEALESTIRSEQKTREALLDDLKRCEIQMTEIEQQKKLVIERIREKYNQDVPSDYSPDEMLQDETELDLSIDRIKRSIESIGPVNMAVQAEFEEEEKRLNHLVEQKNDLLESEHNLRESIQKIDRVARKQFKDTFERIKFNFEKLFTLFFEGGQATIELTGDPDPLESDISISAQPPGKRNASLRALSAGEKALTAISLLFSIYQVKPSPYCILDEVDAPLDDTNVRKFTRVLKKFSNETQFIIVTHNKLTMESANYLYGVTMEQKGVSRLASVRFEGDKVLL